jgi:hypothetical protein
MKSRKAALLGGVSFFIGLAFTASGARAQVQCSSSLTTQTVGYDDGGSMSLPGTVSASGAAVGALVSAINTFNTAYLAQGSAFVANPPAKLEETGGGIWGRAIGGPQRSAESAARRIAPPRFMKPMPGSRWARTSAS